MTTADRVIPRLALVLALLALVAVPLVYSKIISEGKARRGQSCAQSEREHKQKVDALKRTYRLLGTREGRRQLGPGLVQIVVQQLPETEREARVDVAPEFCDEEGVGLKEPDPKLPAPRDFSHLLEGTPRERRMLRQRARQAQRSASERGGGRAERSPVGPRAQAPPSGGGEGGGRRDGGDGGGRSPSPAPSPSPRQPAPSPPGVPGPPGSPGPPGRPGPTPHEPDPSPPPPSDAGRRGGLLGPVLEPLDPVVEPLDPVLDPVCDLAPVLC